MSKFIVNANFKKFNEKHSSLVSIELPEESKELFQNYRIELVDYMDLFNNIVIFIVDKNDNDILQKSVNPKQLNAFQEAFKEIYESLKKMKEDSFYLLGEFHENSSSSI